jgi:hypothetical protein
MVDMSSLLYSWVSTFCLQFEHIADINMLDLNMLKTNWLFFNVSSIVTIIQDKNKFINNASFRTKDKNGIWRKLIRSKINARENRTGNQAWTIQRHWSTIHLAYARSLQHVLTEELSLVARCNEWRVSYQRQELLTLREHLGSPPVFGGVCVAHLFSFLCMMHSTHLCTLHRRNFVLFLYSGCSLGLVCCVRLFNGQG